MSTYRCICNAGYEPDVTGKTCVDINECARDEMICNGGQCKNTPGSFQVNFKRFHTNSSLTLNGPLIRRNSRLSAFVQPETVSTRR